MKHKDKVKLARKIRTQKEIEHKVPIFQTKAWKFRKKNIAKKVKNKEKKPK